MEDFKSYESIVIEGGDQVGKGDATLRIVENLSEDFPVTQISFPMYSLPIGACIRYTLKGEMSSVIKDLNLSAEEEFETRMAMYALNRLEVTNALLDPQYKDRVLLFDRSPYSNALTIAYGLKGAGKISEDELWSYVDKGFEFDDFIIKSLNLKNCVIELIDGSGENWRGNRSVGDDQHECADVQNICGVVYDIFYQKVGPGWTKIKTKDGNGWRPREDILADSLEFICERVPQIKTRGIDKAGDKEILELTDMARSLYKGSLVDTKDLEVLKKALLENSKNEMYESSLKIARQVADSCQKIEWYNEDIRNAFKKLMERCPFCIEFIRGKMGDRYTDLLVESYE